MEHLCRGPRFDPSPVRMMGSSRLRFSEGALLASVLAVVEDGLGLSALGAVEGNYCSRQDEVNKLSLTERHGANDEKECFVVSGQRLDTASTGRAGSSEYAQAHMGDGRGKRALSLFIG